MLRKPHRSPQQLKHTYALPLPTEIRRNFRLTITVNINYSPSTKVIDQMKNALDYVSDYQLKSACKDAICIVPFKVTQMIFAVLADLYHHIVLTHSFKLVSFFLHILY